MMSFEIKLRLAFSKQSFKVLSGMTVKEMPAVAKEILFSGFPLQ